MITWNFLVKIVMKKFPKIGGDVAAVANWRCQRYIGKADSVSSVLASACQIGGPIYTPGESGLEYGKYFRPSSPLKE